RLDGALGHARAECRLDRLGRAHVAHRAHERLPALDLGERQRLGTALRPDALDVEHEGPLDALRGLDFEVLAVEGELAAILADLHPAPPAAGADVHLLDARLEAPRSPPQRDQLRIGVRLPDPLAGSIEDALVDEIAALGVDGGRIGATAVN